MQFSPEGPTAASKRREIAGATAGTWTALIAGVIRRGRTIPALALVASLTATAALARVAHATDSDAETPAPTLRQEWVGFELTPLSVALGSCCGYKGGHLDRTQAGPGGSMRIGRYRWENAYVIPIEAGLYVSSGNGTIFAHLETEGGLIVPGTDRRLEIGVGTGVGVLAMTYNTAQCDGSCNLGGAGWMISFAARYLFFAGPSVTVGAGVRAVIPLSLPDGEVFGSITGRGDMLLGALEVGFGRS